MTTSFPVLHDTRNRAFSGNASEALDGAKEERVEFRASGGLLEILNQLKSKYNLNRSESIRRAVTLFYIAKGEVSKGKGNNLAIVDNEGRVISKIHSF